MSEPTLAAVIEMMEKAGVSDAWTESDGALIAIVQALAERGVAVVYVQDETMWYMDDVKSGDGYPMSRKLPTATSFRTAVLLAAQREWGHAAKGKA